MSNYVSFSESANAKFSRLETLLIEYRETDVIRSCWEALDLAA